MRKVRVSDRAARSAACGSAWLAGPDYTLADICNFAIANGMDKVSPMS